MSNTAEKIKEMARLAVLSNKLTDFHLSNLKQFPFIFFNGVKSAKIEYDLESKKTVGDEPVINNSFISYYLEIDGENDQLDRRFSALEQAVRALFWKNLTVEIYFNDRIQFKSAKNV